MIYKIGMLCKHFKGKSLIEKNIYKIIQMGVNSTDVDITKVKYTGDQDFPSAKNLVVYQNIFQDDMFFCREYEDLAFEFSLEKQKEFLQIHRVEPLTPEEINLVLSNEFKASKELFMQSK